MDMPDKNRLATNSTRNKKHSFIRRLRLSLKYRPEILNLILRMRLCIRQKNALLKKLTHHFKKMHQGICSKNTTVEKNCEQNVLHSLTYGNNGNPEQDIPNKQIQSQRLLLKPNSQSTSNSDENKPTTFDKSTSCECIVKDSFSQTKFINDKDAGVKEDNNLLDDDKTLVNDRHIKLDTVDEKVATNNNLSLSKANSVEKNIKEAFTQTENLFEDSKVDITLNKSDKGKLNVDVFTQTENIEDCIEKSIGNDKLKQTTEKESLGWTKTENGEEEKSIAEQVKEVAQNAMQQSGMVYVESAGMYYDYKTGYYYNSELGLYYHTDTGCYYYYSDEQKTFVFHSYPDRSTETQNRPAKPIRKSKMHKKSKKSDDIDNLTKNFSQDEENSEASKPKRRRLTKQKKKSKKVDKSDIKKDTESDKEKENIDEQKDNKERELEVNEKDENKPDEELEDGECSESDEKSDDKSDESADESDASTATASDDDTVAKHHPPCMRVIVRETNLPKLKVGSLFLVTKDGGTVGREGEHHAILLKDYNISRNHLDIKFDADKRIYTAVDLGSKNGTILNGVRMSESQEVSEPMEVLHGSTLQLGETKLLCHIHAGNDTCGHCEPGLIMEAEDKDKKMAYTRTCSVQVQHQLELARLKNKYSPQPLAIMDTEYNDRAQARREKVGSSHHAEKTQSSDLDTAIAADNKGFKLLEKMGWSKGEGLGKDSQGDTEPIPLVSNEGKTGLGATPVPTAAPVTSKIGPATLRLAARTKMLQPPAKAFQQPTDTDEESE